MANMSRELFDLDGKVVLVTGAAQGLGAAIGNACAVQGATVVLADIEQEQVCQVAQAMSEKTATPVTAHGCDVRDEDQVQQLVQSVTTDQGRIDVLVNNAGIHRRVDPLNISPADLKAVLDVNLVGCLNMASAVGKVMIQQRAGSLINISALGGGVGGLGG